MSNSENDKLYDGLDDAEDMQHKKNIMRRLHADGLISHKDYRDFLFECYLEEDELQCDWCSERGDDCLCADRYLR